MTAVTRAVDEAVRAGDAAIAGGRHRQGIAELGEGRAYRPVLRHGNRTGRIVSTAGATPITECPSACSCGIQPDLRIIRITMAAGARTVDIPVRTGYGTAAGGGYGQGIGILSEGSSDRLILCHRHHAGSESAACSTATVETPARCRRSVQSDLSAGRVGMATRTGTGDIAISTGYGTVAGGGYGQSIVGEILSEGSSDRLILCHRHHAESESAACATPAVETPSRCRRSVQGDLSVGGVGIATRTGTGDMAISTG